MANYKPYKSHAERRVAREAKQALQAEARALAKEKRLVLRELKKATYGKIYYAKNKAARLAYSRAYRKANLEKVKAGVNAWQKRNKAYIREAGKAYRAKNKAKLKDYLDKTKAKRLESLRLWKKRNRTRVNAARRARHQANPLKERAHKLVAYAVKTGRLVRPRQCECCHKAKKVSGHHFDYSLPFFLTWLCDDCHRFIHNLMTQMGERPAGTLPQAL